MHTPVHTHNIRACDHTCTYQYTHIIQEPVLAYAHINAPHIIQEPVLTYAHTSAHT